MDEQTNLLSRDELNQYSRILEHGPAASVQQVRSLVRLTCKDLSLSGGVERAYLALAAMEIGSEKRIFDSRRTFCAESGEWHSPGLVQRVFWFPLGRMFLKIVLPRFRRSVWLHRKGRERYLMLRWIMLRRDQDALDLHFYAGASQSEFSPILERARRENPDLDRHIRRLTGAKS